MPTRTLDLGIAYLNRNMAFMIGMRDEIDGHGSLKLENQSQKYVRERRNYIMAKSLYIVLEEIFVPTY